MATMVRHALRNPTLGQTSHLPTAAALRCTYGPSRARPIVTCSIGGTFLHFLLKNLRIHLLDKFPANKEKLI